MGIRQSLQLYRSTHAARTHPILPLGMLDQHQRLDLADQEDRAVAEIDQALQELNGLWARRCNAGAPRPPVGDHQADAPLRDLTYNLISWSPPIATSTSK